MNRHDLGRFCTESLESAAKRYKTLGFSIIPLLGARNPELPKLPAIKWSRFQHTKATDQDLARWFADQDDIGIGIVCGRISQLVVLDIDDAAVASEFRHLHPELADTFTVKSGTRGLPHFYFRLPFGLVVPTAAYPGADLRGEGSYVVAPPTKVQGHRWEVENPAPIRSLSSVDLRVLLRYLASLKLLGSSAFVINVQSPERSEVSEFRHVDQSNDLVSLYKRHVLKGRNHALFYAALMGRDKGIPQEKVILQLAPVHASQSGSAAEPYDIRYREAVRTIQSAFNRSPRREELTVTGLSNAVRETLLQAGCAAVARVLDGLYAVGVKGTAELTEAEICSRLQAVKVGRRSIMKALTAQFGEQLFFDVVQSPHIPPEYANAASDRDNLNNSCEMSRGAKRVNNSRRGRPARYYRIPTPDDVALLLGIEATGSDTLGAHELSNTRLYRQALHERLLARRPGSYPRAWLSHRLGVSRWTTRRYESALGIQVSPIFVEQPLSWANATVLPEDARDLSYGVFIQIQNGQRYPALRGVAFRLLKQGKRPVLKHQQVNHYEVKAASVGIPTPQTEWVSVLNGENNETLAEKHTLEYPSVGIPTPFPDSFSSQNAAFSTAPTQIVEQSLHGTSIKERGVGIPTLQVEPTFWLCPNCLDFHISPVAPERCLQCDAVPTWEVVPSLIWRDAQALKSWWYSRHQAHRQAERDTQLPIGDQATKLTAIAEVLVGTLQSRIKGLSFANARKLVHQFGTQVVEKAFNALQQRSQVRSPAGFFISLLRSEAKSLLNYKLIENNKSRPEAESALEWLRRLAKSEYLSFIANADDILRMQTEGQANALPA